MRFIRTYSNSYVFEERYRKAPGKNRLTVTCHGASDWNGIPQVRIGGQYFSPAQLSQHIRTWTKLADLYSIRLISCDSATPRLDEGDLVMTPDLLKQPPWSTSFGSQLSLFLPGIFVRVYLGTVASNYAPDFIVSFCREEGREATEEALSEYFRIFKDDSGEHYHCVIFLNGRFYKQRYNPNVPLEF
ncbi:hypothetical protein ID856_18035 [Xenorhabdus sp. 18]|nr:hypothetical protein [Xenorhabdus sp. 18]